MTALEVAGEGRTGAGGGVTFSWMLLEEGSPTSPHSPTEYLNVIVDLAQYSVLGGQFSNGTRLTYALGSLGSLENEFGLG